MSEDASTSECPICKDKECQHHLLARFDESGDEGAFGIGLIDRALCDVNEIEVVLEHVRWAWVQSVQATGKPQAPRWITKERGLRAYFDALGSPGFDLKKYESDEQAAAFLPAETDREIWHARERFLWDVLSSCGWQGEQTEVPFDMPMLSTTYLSWWADKPREIVKTLRAKLKRILSEAGVKVKSTSGRRGRGSDRWKVSSV